MKSILDPSFKYTSSVNTSISKTFARIRKQQREAAKIAENAQRAANTFDSEGNRRVVAIMDGRRKAES